MLGVVLALGAVVANISHALAIEIEVAAVAALGRTGQVHCPGLRIDGAPDQLLALQHLPFGIGPIGEAARCREITVGCGLDVTIDVVGER
ncbi:hypothetical protein D9M68_975830 [compost metagenome]